MNTTSTAPTIYWTTSETTYYVEPFTAIKQVLATARRWQKECGCKKKRHCENYGCRSLDELLLPLRTVRIKRKNKVKRWNRSTKQS